MQYYKGDAKEIQFDLCGQPIMEILSDDRDTFFDEAYACFALGDLLYTENRAPLANAVEQDIFRELFATIFEAFVSAGTFESYLSVFRNIFGDDVTVDFTVSGPGQLDIDLQATGTLTATRLSREILGGSYVYYDRLTSAGDTRVASIPKGFQTEYEAEQMLFELVPAGIYTTISLTIS